MSLRQRGKPPFYCPDARCGEREVEPVIVDGVMRCPTCHATVTANAGLNVQPLRHLSADVYPEPGKKP